MCTVTILPLNTGIRMAVNRDESPARLQALPPRETALGQHRALMPIDPQSGGTWVGATDAGLVFTLLNVYPAPRDRQAPTPRVSRGTIIPRLCEADSLAEAVAMTRELCVADFAPFRLVLADRSQCADVYCTGGVITINAPRDIAEPILFTSSGLGDGVVDPPRRALFEEYFVKGADWRQRQDAYHRHFWPDRRHLSVCMMRPEARTVSLTVVEMGHNQVQMDYFGGAPDQPIEALNARLALRALNGENDQSTRSRTY